MTKSTASDVCAALGVDSVSYERTAPSTQEGSEEELLRAALKTREDLQLLDNASKRIDVLNHEYIQNTRRQLTRVLNQCGVSPDQLYQDDTFDNQSLQTLTTIAVLLKLKGCDKSSFVSAITSLHCQLDTIEYEIEQEIQRERDIHRMMSTEIIPTLSSLDTLRSSLTARASDSESELRALNNEAENFLPVKIVEYEQDVLESQKCLQGSGINNRLVHDELLRLSSQLEDIHQRHIPLTERIAAYKHLPPNLSLAQQKIQDAADELDQLQAQWHEQLAAIETVFD